MLYEVITAIGYGTMKKSDLTGSIASIKSEELHERASSNLGQALQGKVSGVLIRNISSAPGGGVSIIIRGHNSVASDSQPLYIVDGLPLDNINSIPVENIESVEILKDASSTSIYGSRGANGVRITSYNVCYTKLLRLKRPKSLPLKSLSKAARQKCRYAKT